MGHHDMGAIGLNKQHGACDNFWVQNSVFWGEGEFTYLNDNEHGLRLLKVRNQDQRRQQIIFVQNTDSHRQIRLQLSSCDGHRFLHFTLHYITLHYIKSHYI